MLSLRINKRLLGLQFLNSDAVTRDNKHVKTIDLKHYLFGTSSANAPKDVHDKQRFETTFRAIFILKSITCLTSSFYLMNFPPPKAVCFGIGRWGAIATIDQPEFQFRLGQ